MSSLIVSWVVRRQSPLRSGGGRGRAAPGRSQGIEGPLPSAIPGRTFLNKGSLTEGQQGGGAHFLWERKCGLVKKRAREREVTLPKGALVNGEGRGKLSTAVPHSTGDLGREHR